MLAIKKPIAKRLIKDQAIAVILSFIGRGIMRRISMIPNTIPATVPDTSLLIFT